MKQRNWYTIFLLSTCIVAGMIYIAGVYAPDGMKIARAALQYVFNPSEGSFSEGSFWTDGVEEEMQSTDDAAADDLNSTDADSSDGTASDNTDIFQPAASGYHDSPPEEAHPDSADD